MIISCWNIKGLNKSYKQQEVAKLVYTNHINIIGMVETKAKESNKIQIQI